MSEVSTYLLGQLGFSVAGDHPVATCVREELAPLAAPDVLAPPLRFEFVDVLSPLTDVSAVTPMRVSDGAFSAELGGLACQVTRNADGLSARIRPKGLSWKQRAAPAALLRSMDWNFLTPDETLAKNFIYGVFDYLSQVAQLPLGQSHLHASSMEREGCAVALIGWGGVGKTSAMLDMVMKHGWRFLSDDLVTVDVSGQLWRSPKRLQVYAYNVAGNAGLRQALMGSRSLVDRGAWTWRRHLRGPHLVRRRVAAETLLGSGAVADRARLTHALFVDRSDCSSFAVTALAIEDLAERAATTLLRELQPFVDYSIAVHSTGRQPALPAVAELYARTRDVLIRAFAGVRTCSISVPLHADPIELSSYVRGVLHESVVSS